MMNQRRRFRLYMVWFRILLFVYWLDTGDDRGLCVDACTGEVYSAYKLHSAYLR